MCLLYLYSESFVLLNLASILKEVYIRTRAKEKNNKVKEI